jgi:hypothetical protein
MNVGSETWKHGIYRLSQFIEIGYTCEFSVKILGIGVLAIDPLKGLQIVTVRDKVSTTQLKEHQPIKIYQLI